MTAAGIEAVETHPDCEAALGAIRWTPAGPAPWPSARPVLDVAIESLPTIEDDFSADLIEQLSLALEDRDDELRTVRMVLSEALALAHQQQREIERIRGVYHATLDALRTARHQAQGAGA